MTGFFYIDGHNVPGGGWVSVEPELQCVPICSSWCAKRFAGNGGRVARRDWWRP